VRGDSFMSLSLSVFLFVNVWWMMLFFVLPFGVRQTDHSSAVEYAAAPSPHRWKKLFLINTALSLAFTLIIVLLVNSGIVPVRGLLDTL